MKLRQMVATTTFLMASLFTQFAYASVDVCLLRSAVNSAVYQGNVLTRVKDGIVTLHGRADTVLDSKQAERAALRFEGVKSVRNYIVVD